MSITESADDVALGWVYVLSHPQMKVLKVGFTYRTVLERLNELSSTAVPGSFVWEYGVLVEHPEQVERIAHQGLNAYRVTANREFFDCPLATAVASLIAATERNLPRNVHDRNLIEERAARIRAEQSKLAQWRASVEERLSERTKSIQFEANSLRPNYLWFWLGHAFLAAVAIDSFAPVKTEFGLFVISAVIGSLTGFFHQEHVHDKRKSEASIQSRLNEIEQDRNSLNEQFAEQLALINKDSKQEKHHPSDFRSVRAPLKTERQPKVVQPQELRPSPSSTQTLEERIRAAENRVIREIPNRFFACNNCGRTVNLNAKAFCTELRCPAKLLADA